MKIGTVQIPDYLLLGAAALVFIMFGPQIVGWLARKTTGAVAGSIVQGTTGAVLGIAEAVGIPDTDAAKCQQYVEQGDYWNASFYCPAGTFLKSAAGAIYDVATGSKVGTTQPGKAEIVTIQPYTSTGQAYVPGEMPPTGALPPQQIVSDGTLITGSQRSLIR